MERRKEREKEEQKENNIVRRTEGEKERKVRDILLLTLEPMGGGEAINFTPCGFVPFTQKSSGNPYLKILELTQLCCGFPYEPPLTALLGHLVQKQ